MVHQHFPLDDHGKREALNAQSAQKRLLGVDHRAGLQGFPRNQTQLPGRWFWGRGRLHCFPFEQDIYLLQEIGGAEGDPEDDPHGFGLPEEAAFHTGTVIPPGAEEFEKALRIAFHATAQQSDGLGRTVFKGQHIGNGFDFGEEFFVLDPFKDHIIGIRRFFGRPHTKA